MTVSSHPATEKYIKGHFTEVAAQANGDARAFWSGRNPQPRKVGRLNNMKAALTAVLITRANADVHPFGIVSSRGTAPKSATTAKNGLPTSSLIHSSNRRVVHLDKN